jgi:hypothetical protein
MAEAKVGFDTPHGNISNFDTIERNRNAKREHDSRKWVHKE